MKTERFLKEELQKIHLTLKDQLSKKTEQTIHFQYSNLNLFELLNYLNCENIFYFKSKYEDFSLLGLGVSQIVPASELNAYLEKNPLHYLIAAFLFEQDPSISNFYLPEWIFIKRNDQTDLIISKSFEYKNFSIPNLFFNTSFDPNLDDFFIPPWQSYDECPEHDDWQRMINACDEFFDKGELEKIVLSRKKIFNYHEPIESIAFFKAVMEANNGGNSSYAIFYQISFQEAFISLTPEKLFSIKNSHFESISLAASAPRGSNEEEDKNFEELLNSSDKLSREHNIVTEEIIRKIGPLVESIEVSPLQIMKLPYIQHRSIPIKAKLLPDIGPLELITLLHPTPAIGGLPWNKAKIKIAKLEPYTRNFYAAPIGIVSAHYIELAVGIRSALIEKSTITLFGGAGIVKGSTAEEEWIETATKMNPFLKVINHV
jgi:menaquinone-specific isochorismate synthase